MAVNAPCLEVIGGEMNGTQFRLLGEMVTLGRSEDCDIRLEGTKGVSRTHAQIILSGNDLLLRDLGSANGTLVNGKKITETFLQPGSKIQIGNIALRLLVPGGELAPAGNGQPLAVRQAELKAGGAANELVEGYAEAAEGAEAPALMLAAGQGAGKVVTLFASIAGLVALIYLLNLAILPSRVPLMRVRVVRIGETRVLAIGTQFDSYQAVGEAVGGGGIIKVADYVGLIRPKTIDTINGYLQDNGLRPIRFILYTGLSRGDSFINFYGAGGKIVARPAIAVRGVVPRWWDNRSDQEVRDMADQMMRDGEKFMRDGKSFQGMKNFSEAGVLYTRIEEEELRAKAQLRESEARRIFREILNTKIVAAIRAAFPRQSGVQDEAQLMTGYYQLEDLKMMISDENNLEYQILDHLRVRIMGMVSR